MAAPECPREVRKRRERRDSGGSHERKERRPHSEERPVTALPPPPLHDHNRLESERRAERLSRARRPAAGGKRRRQPFRVTKQYRHEQTKENEYLLAADDEPADTADDHTPIQKVQLFEELEGMSSECGVRSERGGWEEVAVSESAERSRPMQEPSRPPAPAVRDHTTDRRLYKINKKITVLQKNIAAYERNYEAEHGSAMTPSECITDVQLTCMYESLRRLQAEKKCIKSDPVEYARALQAARLQKQRDEQLDASLRSEKSIAEVVEDIEAWLQGCREAAGRAATPEGSWTASQLAAEKSCVQRALLKLEAARGRPPAHSAERGVARRLYERYRTVKRALAAVRPDAVIGGTNGELATIHEHEAMLFNSSVDSSSDSQEKHSICQESECSAPESPNAPAPAGAQSPPAPAADDPPSNEGLHCLTLDELTRALTEAKLQKCVMKRAMKELEEQEGADSRREEYHRYRGLRARIRLLNALINKHHSATSAD